MDEIIPFLRQLALAVAQIPGRSGGVDIVAKMIQEKLDAFDANAVIVAQAAQLSDSSVQIAAVQAQVVALSDQKVELSTQVEQLQSAVSVLQTLVPPIEIALVKLPEILLGKDFSFQFFANGGTGAYFFSLSQGALSSGLVLDEKGILSGVPKEAGEFSATLQVKDTGGLSSEMPFSLTVVDPSTGLGVKL